MAQYRSYMVDENSHEKDEITLEIVSFTEECPRNRDAMQSSRSYDENIEETITDFYAELKTAIKQSKKRKRG